MRIEFILKKSQKIKEVFESMLVVGFDIYNLPRITIDWRLIYVRKLL